MAALTEHPAVVNHGSGVYSSDLADFTRALAEAAALRMEGVGDEQYGGEVQKFETESIGKYVDELLEEIADIFAYVSIIAIKALALRDKVSA